MLWQPSLPEVYRTLSPADLRDAITERRKVLGDSLVILGHHYQTDEVIQHADHTGDSLKLSQIAARLAGERTPTNPVRFVIFCGVHFMAETADMLTPSDVAVILPDLSAGCSMADMAQYDDTVDAWNAIHTSLREQGWEGTIVPITYVNSSAAIKAFVGQHGGACCTSSNALEVFQWAMRGSSPLRSDAGLPATSPDSLEEIHGKASRSRSRAALAPEGRSTKVLFLPDQHLGRNTAHRFGIDVARASCVYDPRLRRKGEELGGATPQQLVASDVILWAGHCSVHKLFRPEHCHALRAADKLSNTHTTILVHPECCKEVVDLADMFGSTEHIINTIRAAKPGSRWAIGTEVHLVSRLAREAQARGVHVRILSDCQCLCTTMYRIDQPHLLWVLDNLSGNLEARTGSGKAPKPRVVNQISVPTKVRELALLAIDRMLELSPNKPASAVTNATRTQALVGVD
jgi:quinolinate synthase